MPVILINGNFCQEALTFYLVLPVYIGLNLKPQCYKHVVSLVRCLALTTILHPRGLLRSKNTRELDKLGLMVKSMSIWHVLESCSTC